MKRIVLLSAALLLLAVPLMAQDAIGRPDDPFAHTYSIVARDSATGEMGVAVQSHWFSVGSIVSWAEAGVGAIATQSFVNPAFGPDGLMMLRQDIAAQTVLDSLISRDEGRAVRQLAVVDAGGNVAAWTGDRCIQAAGHQVGDGYSVQANMMLHDTVVPAMAAAYEAAEGSLAERLVAALKAAQAEGGDIRGKQSAALLVVRAEPTGDSWVDRKVDLRVEDHESPVLEIERLLRVHRAYEHMNRGDLALEHGEMEAALAEYARAEDLYPDNPEMSYWTAVTLAETGELEKALPRFKQVFAVDDNWRELTRRLRDVGMLNVDEEAYARILDQ